MHEAGQETLVLADDLTDEQKPCVLAHELSHGLQHPPGAQYPEPTPEARTNIEQIAHAAAEILLAQLGWPHYQEVAERAQFSDYRPALQLEPEQLKEAREMAQIIFKASLLYPLPHGPMA